MAAPASRFCVAFGQPTLTEDPTWTNLDELYPNLVAGYTIDRGRSFELDRCDVGRATVTLNDTDGVLAPWNPGAAHPLEPLLQVALCRWNPFAGAWRTRFRGFIESAEYEFDPSQKLNRLTVECVDIFELVQAVEMHPGYFGESYYDVPTSSRGQVYYPSTDDEPAIDADGHSGMKIRCDRVLAEAGIPAYWTVTFSGNVSLRATVYSPGESCMTAIQDAADAEWPAVANVYGDRMGRLCAHGRFARFDPISTAATVTPDVWDFQDWKCGDHAAVAANPSERAHVRGFTVSRDLGKIINRALCTPMGIADSKVQGQTVSDPALGTNDAIRAWSAQDLILKAGVTDGLGALAEAKGYAQYYVDNYKAVQNRVSSVSFRSSSLDAVGSAANWKLLSRCDISDRIAVTLSSPGGGGFSGATDDSRYFIEGIHEDVRPMWPQTDDVTMTLDLSPATYYAESPFD